MNRALLRALRAFTLVLILPLPSRAITVPAPELYLPTNTLAFLSIPNARLARQAWSQQAPAQLWAEPSLRPLREAFLRLWNVRLFQPWHTLTSLDLRALASAVDGQMTVAWIPSGPSNATSSPPDVVALLEAGSLPNRLAPLLPGTLAFPPSPHPAPQRVSPTTATATATAGSTVASNPWFLGSIPFQSFPVEARQLQSVLRSISPETFLSPVPSDSTIPSPAEMTALHVGWTGSVLLIGTSTQALATMVQRLEDHHSIPPRLPSKPPTDPTPDTPGSEDADTLLVRGTVNAAAVFQRLRANPSPPARRTFGVLPRPGRLLDVLGVSTIPAVHLALHARDHGWFLDLRIPSPLNSRPSWWRALQHPPGLDELHPPRFLPAETLAFSQLRLQGPALWSGLEQALGNLDTSLLGLFQLVLDQAGRTENPDFEFQRDVVQTLGDDWILAALPRADSSKLPGTFVAHGSPATQRLLESLHALANPDSLSHFLPPRAPAPVRTRRTIGSAHLLSVAFPALPLRPDLNGIVHFAQTGNWLGIATDLPALDPLLADQPAPALADQPSFNRALAVIRSPDDCLLQYLDERAFVRRWLASTPAAGEPSEPGAFGAFALGMLQRFLEPLVSNLDRSDVPPLEVVERHLGFAIACGRMDADGFLLTTYHPRPTPP